MFCISAIGGEGGGGVMMQMMNFQQEGLQLILEK